MNYAELLVKKNRLEKELEALELQIEEAKKVAPKKNFTVEYTTGFGTRTGTCTIKAVDAEDAQDKSC